VAAAISKELGTGVLQRGGEIADANVTALDP
jgi:hypothetical protein